MNEIVLDLVFAQLPGKKMAKWMRTIFVGDQGVVYVPAAATGNEATALLSASCDGVGYVTCRGHPFLPTWWMKREYHEDESLVRLLNKVESRAKKAFKEWKLKHA